MTPEPAGDSPDEPSDRVTLPYGLVALYTLRSQPPKWQPPSAQPPNTFDQLPMEPPW